MNKNLELLFSLTNKDREITISKLEENLGYKLPTRKENFSIEDEKFLEEISEDYLRVFFSKIWKGNLTQEQRTQKNNLIVETIKKFYESPSSVLDIGCGFNHLKPLIPTLIGIDPYNEHADIQISLNDFLVTNTSKFDVIICQGNLHFGTKEQVEENIKKVISILKLSGLLFIRFNVSKIPKLYPYVDICDDWENIEEVVQLFDKYINRLSDVVIDNNHRIEFFGVKK